MASHETLYTSASREIVRETDGTLWKRKRSRATGKWGRWLPFHQPFIQERWGKCRRCEHVAKYRVRGLPGMRLRDHKCERCGYVLGRGANTLARPTVAARARIARLERTMSVRVRG